MGTILNQAINPELSKISYPCMDLRYTIHAQCKMLERDMPKLSRIVITEGEVVEVYPEDKKIVVRLRRLLGNYDYCLVLRAVSEHTIKSWLVITVYKNHWEDNHATLKLSN